MNSCIYFVAYECILVAYTFSNGLKAQKYLAQGKALGSRLEGILRPVRAKAL